MVRRSRRSSGRLKTVESPLFPGYVFCRFEKDKRLPILMLPSVLHVVGIGKEPVPVDSAEIASIQVIADSPLCNEPWPFLNTGERVQVISGPLSGAQGVILDVKNKYRLIASLTLLRRSVAVEIDREWVQPCERAAGHRLPETLRDWSRLRRDEASKGEELVSVGA